MIIWLYAAQLQPASHRPIACPGAGALQIVSLGWFTLPDTRRVYFTSLWERLQRRRGKGALLGRKCPQVREGANS